MESGQNILDVFMFEYELDDALYTVTYEEDDFRSETCFKNWVWMIRSGKDS
ncbi:hypothetical protein PO124_33205 [Bacillus licheniformis]|nr:hypothetical protein [Bacillus licheniformis]